MSDKDTYEHAKELADFQIAKERKMAEEIDAFENDVLGVWDEYYEIPYGAKYHIRIRAELPSDIEQRLYHLINNCSSSGVADADLNSVLSTMTLGLYVGETLKAETDIAFWENPHNWNMRKVESILMSYLTRLKGEREAIFSFLE